MGEDCGLFCGFVLDTERYKRDLIRGYKLSHQILKAHQILTIVIIVKNF